jgi:hypothetical protein
MNLIQTNGLILGIDGCDMTNEAWEERLVRRKVTYTLFVDGEFFIIENVPARVNLDTGEQFFSPQTVEEVQRIIWEKRKPLRVVQTAVYDFGKKPQRHKATKVYPEQS